jgi:hypothetical protein
MRFQDRGIEITFVEVNPCDLLIPHGTQTVTQSRLVFLKFAIGDLVIEPGRHTHELHPLLKPNELKNSSLLEAHVLLVQCLCPFSSISLVIASRKLLRSLVGSIESGSPLILV